MRRRKKPSKDTPANKLRRATAVTRALRKRSIPEVGRPEDVGTDLTGLDFGEVEKRYLGGHTTVAGRRAHPQDAAMSGAEAAFLYAKEARAQRRITRYRVLESCMSEQLLSQVERALSDGWELQGGISVIRSARDGHMYYQAIIKRG